MDKTILKISTLKSSAHLNMKLLKGEHYEALNATKKNGTTKTIEENDKLIQNLEEKI